MGDEAKSSSKSDILMLPWLAIGHITPYLHLANRLAERGYKISFLLPNKAKLIVQHLNLHPNLITFHSLSVPHVDGLPHGTETTKDISGYRHLTPLMAVALDLTRPQVEQAILDLKPDFAFYDTAHWVPDITAKLGIKSVAYHVVSAASLAIAMVPACSKNYCIGGELPPRLMTPEELRVPPPGYPSDTVVMRKHEADKLKQFICREYGSGITFGWRINASLKSGDAIALRTTREIEGQFCDYLSSQFEKPVLLTGPVLPESDTDLAALEERWASWLGGHGPDSVVYCAFGSEVVLEKEQFKEILLGLEMAGYPFFAALKPPKGCSRVEDAMPEGFEERVRGRGVVHGGWVQQPLVLKHPSVGCFLSHCGFGTMWESLLSGPQLVLLPELGENILSTRNMVEELKVAVEVDKDESGWVPRERVCRAVKEAMDEGSAVGRLIRENHAKWREALGGHGSVLGGYIDSFVQKLSEI